MSATAYTEPFDFNRVVVRAFDILRRNLMLLVALAAILYGLPKLGATFLHLVTGELWVFHAVFGITAGLYGLIACFGLVALQASVVRVAAADLNDQSTSILPSLRTGLGFLLPLFGLFLVTFIGILVGTICLIVPGLFLATIWAVATPALVVERLDIGQALSRSAALTIGYRWPVFFIGLVFFLVSGLFHSSVDHEGLFGHGFGIFSFASHAAHELLGDVMDTIFALIGSVLCVSVYYELRMLKEDVTPEDFAGVLV